jgi:hypothetical protein
MSRSGRERSIFLATKMNTNTALRKAGTGQYRSFTNLLANGRLILKAVTQRPLSIGGHQPFLVTRDVVIVRPL